MHLLLSILLLLAPSTQAHTNRCVDCHFSHITQADEAARFGAWSHSSHARAGVSCDRCHGGDPEGKTPWAAHRGVLRPDDPRSAVHHANLTETCGACHPREQRAFRTTNHAKRAAGPVLVTAACTTCHGTMSARIPGPRDVEGQCRVCHPGTRSFADRALTARRQVEQLQSLHLQMVQAENRLRRERDVMRRLESLEADRRASRAYAATVEAFHSFDSTLVWVRLDQTSRAVTALIHSVDAP
jgi:cytochrome c554/c'-like protein